ncbi:MAG: XRE family transcriptional regulator [Phycisphaerae bacterium]
MTVNPNAITLARESRGWSQGDLASARDVTQARISKEELGLLSITQESLSATARLLQYDEEFFKQNELIFGLGGDFLYRKKASLPARTKRRIEAEANIRRFQLERLLEAVQIETSLSFPAIQPEEYGGKIDLIAHEVRRRFSIPEGPIPNLTKVLENAGCVIFTMEFESNLIDGTNIRVGESNPVMFLNEKVSGERHRFNLAHELGHLVMHYVSTMGDAEQEANDFANEFLMPKSLIRYDLRNLDLEAAARLKSVWGVSMAALIHRARQLRTITDAAYTRMFKMLSGSGMRQQEPFPIEFEVPQTFERLKKWHREKLGFGDEEMRRLLFTDKLGTLPVPEKPKLKLAGLFDDDTN